MQRGFGGDSVSPDNAAQVKIELREKAEKSIDNLKQLRYNRCIINCEGRL